MQMKIYLRRIDKQCIEKQISIKTYILKDFFHNMSDKETIRVQGVLSGFSDDVSILLSTDPRLGGGIKKIIDAEAKEIAKNNLGYGVAEGDILLFSHIQNKEYKLEIIYPSDSRYPTLSEMIDDPNFTKSKKQNLHLLILNDDEELENQHIYIDEETRLDGAKNIIFYGVPGSGKSHAIETQFCDNNSVVEKIVFHPEYSYCDFVGQIMPVTHNGIVNYQFVPGPFTNILKKAYQNPHKKHILIIDEINRGNAPAIFGEIFQLLDRIRESKNAFKKGTSEYGINNADIAKIVYGNSEVQIRIPSNMWIIATMNTSDQNIFTLDTAFQRRFSMELIENSFDNASDEFKNTMIPNTTISWQKFCITINELITQYTEGLVSTEDKRLGVYFVSKDDLQSKKNFAHKVIKYLWDDVCRFDRQLIFETREFCTLESAIKHFVTHDGNAQFNIFNENVRTQLNVD